MTRSRSLLLFVALFLCASDAMAYLDPNAGGMVFQMLVPVIAAVVGWSSLIKQKLYSGLSRVWAKFGRKKAAQ